MARRRIEVIANGLPFCGGGGKQVAQALTGRGVARGSQARAGVHQAEQDKRRRHPEFAHRDHLPFLRDGI